MIEGPQDQPPEILLRAGDVARLGHTTRQTVASHSRRGRIRVAAQTPDGHRLYLPSDAAEWVARRRRDAA